jgi:hypothetical protein
MTYGLNWKPMGSSNWMIRPEIRYDWYSPDDTSGAAPLPYGNFDEYGQLYGGCDIIWQF